MDKVLAFISQAQLILSGLSPVVLSMIAAVIEMGLRFVKSPKPLSIIYGVGGIFKKIGQGFSGLGQVFTTLGALSDKILPQNVQPPVASSDQAKS